MHGRTAADPRQPSIGEEQVGGVNVIMQMSKEQERAWHAPEALTISQSSRASKELLLMMNCTGRAQTLVGERLLDVRHGL